MMASKQINYYMDFEAFRQLAQKALDEGCSIILNELTDTPQTPARDLSAVTPEHARYFFCVPGFEPEFVRTPDERYYPDRNGMRMVMMLEAGYSSLQSDGLITRERLFSASFAVVGHELIPRPAEVGRLYDKLARLARKLAPMRAYPHPSGETEKWNVSPAIATLAGEDGARLQAIANARRVWENRPSPEEQAERDHQLRSLQGCTPRNGGRIPDALHAILGLIPGADQSKAMLFTPPEEQNKPE